MLQHSKSFKQPLENKQQLDDVLQQLLIEMRISKYAQFRLIGVGVYQLSEQQDPPQLSLWSIFWILFKQKNKIRPIDYTQHFFLRYSIGAMHLSM